MFAVGDCCTHFKFTHVSDFMARTVIRNALFFGRGTFSSLFIPWATYTEPEVAHVGMYPADLEVCLCLLTSQCAQSSGWCHSQDAHTSDTLNCWSMVGCDAGSQRAHLTRLCTAAAARQSPSALTPSPGTSPKSTAQSWTALGQAQLHASISMHVASCLRLAACMCTVALGVSLKP